MDLHEEIERKAFELYKKKGCLEGADIENWLDAERIVLSRHASQDMEEPEGEEALIEEETITEEVEETEAGHASQEKEEEERTNVIEEIEVREPFIAKKKGPELQKWQNKSCLRKRVARGKRLLSQKGRDQRKRHDRYSELLQNGQCQ